MGAWAQAQRRWIALASLLIMALVFALWNHPTVLTIMLLVVILLVLLALLAASGRAAAVERVTPHRPESGE
ncbi:hypothetical protein [Streptomyces sp. NRRL WC-3618]|uniref:hypothetical protein n=1 Tax=Streptomyces sp. NRRL WC-3618 TaxID=1519490 RepID=UPI001F471651|nr:hypothetical protein [Streptomyces sp. NRRL WC-3618]